MTVNVKSATLGLGRATEWQFVPSPEDAFPKTLTTQDRLELLSTIRGILPGIAEIATNGHQDALDAVLQGRRAECSLRTAVDLLSELSERGFAWSDIAQLLKVSVPALRKWRLGESDPTADHRRSIATLVAFIQILEEQCRVDDVASWLEIPLIDDFNIDAFELYVGDRLDLVYEVAAGRLDPKSALDQFRPDWRQVFASRVDVILDNNGVIAIRPKA